MLKKVLLPLMLLLLVASVSAATEPTIAVTVFEPDGNTYYPNQGDDFMDVTFRVVATNDTNANPAYAATIQFTNGDTNFYVANDTNLSEAICTYATPLMWEGTGAVCTIRYTFPYSGTVVGTATHVLDFNITAKGAAGDTNGSGRVNTTFIVDNRYISAAVEAMLSVITVVLVAAALVGVVLVFAGRMEPQTAMALGIAAAVSVIAVIVVSFVIATLTP